MKQIVTINPFLRMKRPRTAVADRKLPEYTKKEETANMVTHIIGSVFGLTALVLCTVFASLRQDVPGIITGVLYGISMLVVYVVSSVYHGLAPDHAGFGKRVMQVIDHCSIYTAGMIPFLLELRHKQYCHSVFHVCILLGSVLHFVGIFKYCIMSV